MWIDRKVKLPKPGSYVYALFDFGDKFDIKRVNYVSGYGEFLSDNITHWMEYPEIMPPKVIENKFIDNLKKIENRDRKLKELGIK